MKTILFEGVANTRITVVALDRLLKKIGVEKYTLTETRMDDGEDYAIPIFVLGVEVDDETATMVTLKYSSVDIIDMISVMSAEMLSNLKSIGK